MERGERVNLCQPRVLRNYVGGLAVGWSLVIVILLGINFAHERSQAVETARTQARSNFQRDVIYRHWNAETGTVYAPVSEKIRPNPYLADIPERDVTTTDGRKLTLVNPSYMTRLVFDMAAASYGLKGHITSLRPIRPENRPDPWEEVALTAFARGSTEESSVERIGGGEYLRLMKPLTTEEGCLKCHGSQGYRVGEIRGGISVAVPMEPLRGIARQNSIFVATSFLVLWGIGMVGIAIGAARLQRTIRERDRAEGDLLTRTEELETANRELDMFSHTVSHDLRSPLTVVGGYCQLLQRTAPETHLQTCQEYTGIMLDAVQRMEKLITTLLDFSRVTRGELTRTTVDLTAVAQELTLELRQREPRRQASFTIAPDLTLEADEGLVRVVMHNLMGNAWKYSGKCDVTHIEVGAVERDGKRVFFVRDNGIGFEAGEAAKIFDTFQRLDNARDFVGSGIGLATVKRIIARHGGEIDCSGEVGKGATFYFSFG